MYNSPVCTHLSNGPLIAFSVCNILNPKLHELTDDLSPLFVCFVDHFVQMKACCSSLTFWACFRLVQRSIHLLFWKWRAAWTFLFVCFSTDAPLCPSMICIYWHIRCRWFHLYARCNVWFSCEKALLNPEYGPIKKDYRFEAFVRHNVLTTTELHTHIFDDLKKKLAVKWRLLLGSSFSLTEWGGTNNKET